MKAGCLLKRDFWVLCMNAGSVEGPGVAEGFGRVMLRLVVAFFRNGLIKYIYVYVCVSTIRLKECLKKPSTNYL